MIFEDYMQKIRDIGKEVGERDVSAPFMAASNQMALGRTSELEALNRQQIEAEQQARAQQQDRGFETLGGSPAAERRFNEAVAAGGQRYNQAASQLGIQQGQAERDRDAQGDKYRALALTTGAQYEAQVEAQERAAELQREMAQLQAASRALDRQHAQAMNAANNATQRAGIAAQTANARAQIQVAQMRIKADIRRTQIANPQFSGGGMTASYSTGASNFQDHLKSMGVMR